MLEVGQFWCMIKFLHFRYVFESPMPLGRLVRQVADKAQILTQRSWTRPYGVGLLVGGYDQTGAKLFYNCPSGNFYDYKAMAIGARSQVWSLYVNGALYITPL